MMSEFQVPPEAILWKDTDDSTNAIKVWIRQTDPHVVVDRVDSMIGALLKIDLGVYGFQVRPGMLVMKDQHNGLFSAVSLQYYNETYM